MPLFRCTIEDVAFTSLDKSHDPIELELDENFLIGYSQTRRKEGTFPKGVLGVLKATATPDDSSVENGRDSDGVKLFVSIDLIIEAEDEYNLPDTDRLENLLTHLTDELSTDLDLERNWEYLEEEPMDVAGHQWLEAFVALEDYEMDASGLTMDAAMTKAIADNSVGVIEAAIDAVTAGGVTVFETKVGADPARWVLTKAGEIIRIHGGSARLVEREEALNTLKERMEAPTFELLAYQFEHEAPALRP